MERETRQLFAAHKDAFITLTAVSSDSLGAPAITASVRRSRRTPSVVDLGTFTARLMLIPFDRELNLGQ
jgi:hypothetical protein